MNVNAADMKGLEMFYARLFKLLQVKNELPEQEKTLFNDLYVDGKDDDQIASERRVPLQKITEQKNAMLRQLMAASS